MDWVPFVLEDAKRALTRWPNAQDRGMWAAGFYSGAAQALTMGGESESFLDGYACGNVARGDADKNRARISEVRASAARARWDREQPKQIVMDANAYAVEDANASPIADAQAMHKTNKTNKTRQDTTQQTKQAKSTRPTEAEWIEYCCATWPDWQSERAAESWAYYEGKGWLVGKSPCKDWKAVARTAHGNARDWGKLGIPAKPDAPDYSDKSVWPFGDPKFWPPTWTKHPTENRPLRPGETK